MKTVIIAELGINHNGDIELCKQLLSAAKNSGAHAVKLQINHPDKISNNNWLINVQKKARLTVQEMIEARLYAQDLGIDIFSSVGDVTALVEFESAGFSKIKISSSNLLNGMLHEEVASKGIPAFVSTGDADIESIKRVVNIYASHNCQITLLHCIPKYPTPANQCGLSSIAYLRNKCGVPVGYSDHTLGTEAPAVAVALGAVVIEKHFTLDKKMTGPDHFFSADPDEFADMVQRIRTIEEMAGNAEELYASDRDRTDSIVRRAVLSRIPLDPGHVIGKDEIIIARPSKQNAKAINPLNYRSVIGRTVLRQTKPFEALTERHFTNQ